MSEVLQFPPKCDFAMNQGDTAPYIEATLVDGTGKVVQLYGTGATVRFVMIGENSGETTSPKISGSATIVTDPSFVQSSGVITIANHGFQAGRPVMLSSTGNLPSGWNNYTVYYPVNITQNTFQLSLSAQGLPVIPTDAGTGTFTMILGRVRYQWVTGDTDTTGKFWAQFKVTYSNGQIQSFPNDRTRHAYIFVYINQKAG